MSPEGEDENWILPGQTGQPTFVNAARPPIVTSNRFATFSEDLSVTTAGDTQNQAPAVITPTYQEQAHQLDQDQLREDDNNGDLSDQQHQQEGAKDEDDNCIGLEIIMADSRTLSELLGPTNNKPVKNPSQLEI